MEVSEVTGFKHFNRLEENKDRTIILNKYPTYYPWPLDFRVLKE